MKLVRNEDEIQAGVPVYVVDCKLCGKSHWYLPLAVKADGTWTVSALACRTDVIHNQSVPERRLYRAVLPEHLEP